MIVSEQAKQGAWEVANNYAETVLAGLLLEQPGFCVMNKDAELRVYYAPIISRSIVHGIVEDMKKKHEFMDYRNSVYEVVLIEDSPAEIKKPRNQIVVQYTE